MDGVIEAAKRHGFPEEARHLEYFSIPEQPDYNNHSFTVKLARAGKELLVPEDKSISDVLQESGIPIDVKCSDGICGVCKCGIVEGEVQHRDFVLSKKQRETEMITCQSRAAAGCQKITLICEVIVRSILPERFLRPPLIGKNTSSELISAHDRLSNNRQFSFIFV